MLPSIGELAREIIRRGGEAKARMGEGEELREEAARLRRAVRWLHVALGEGKEGRGGWAHGEAAREMGLVNEASESAAT